MPIEEEVTKWLAKLGEGDERAAEVIWEIYFSKLVKLARRKLDHLPRRVADEEDVALSALASFYRGMREHRFDRLKDRHDLWKLLVTIVYRKACAEGRRHYCQKRGGRRVRGLSALRGPDSKDGGEEGIAVFLGREPTPELAAEVADECRRLLGCLDEPLRQIAQWTLEGLGTQEIADRLGCVRRSVERKINLIRGRWAEL